MTAYENLSFLFEETTEQVYVIHLPLLRARFLALRSDDATTIGRSDMLWLQVDGDKPLIVSPK